MRKPTIYFLLAAAPETGLPYVVKRGPKKSELDQIAKDSYPAQKYWVSKNPNG